MTSSRVTTEYSESLLMCSFLLVAFWRDECIIIIAYFGQYSYIQFPTWDVDTIDMYHCSWTILRDIVANIWLICQ